MTREEAIKWVDDRMCWGRGTFTENHPPNIDECWEAGCMAIKALKDRPQGEWIAHTTAVGGNEYIEYSHCSECGEIAFVRMNYCPNCGADMRGDNNERPNQQSRRDRGI